MRAPVLQKALVITFLVACAAVLAWKFGRSPDRVVRRQAVSHRQIAARVLAELVAAQVHPKHVLILGNPFSQKPGQPNQVYAYDEAGVDGIKEGFAHKVECLEVFPQLSQAALAQPDSVPIDPHTTTPLSFMTSPQAWDTLLMGHPDSEVWVSLIGLPVGVPDMKVWQQAQPRLALLLPDLRMVGDMAAIKAGFHSGKILVAVLNQPGAPAEGLPLSDYQTEFSRRFILVTRENIERVLQAFPQLFDGN